MTKFSKIALLAVAGWGLPGLAAAQTAQSTMSPAAREKATLEQTVAAGGYKYVAGVETRITTGRPYSAEAVTESLQVLGDGNRIVKKSATRVYRDSEGRTRREQINGDGQPRSISISDPVAGANFTLDPTTKTAYQANVLALRAKAVADAGGGRGGRLAATASPARTPSEQTRLQAERTRAARVEMAGTSRPAATQMKRVHEYAASGGRTSHKEDLGEQLIEGVRATGVRTTTVIPPGGIGNVNEIRIVSEQWFSPDLEVLVMTKHSDPRVGETIYKLTNIVRGQPDPNLFTVPGDYTAKARPIRSPQ